MADQENKEQSEDQAADAPVEDISETQTTAETEDQPVEQRVTPQKSYNYQQQEHSEPSQKQAPSAPTNFIKNRPAFISLACGLIGLLYYGMIFGAVAVAMGFFGRKIEQQRIIATLGMVIGIIDVLGGFFSTVAR